LKNSNLTESSALVLLQLLKQLILLLLLPDELVLLLPIRFWLVGSKLVHDDACFNDYLGTVLSMNMLV
jgi:hypothetical protein